LHLLLVQIVPDSLILPNRECRMLKYKSLPTLAGAAALAIVAVIGLPAHANLILVQNSPTGPTPAATVAASFVDLTAQGFGNNPRLLTLQTDGVETGSVTPVNQNQGDAIPNNGGNKSNTPTLSALGWTDGAHVGIGFNSNQTGQTGITMQSLTLTIFENNAPTFTPLGTFNLATSGQGISNAPITFTAADLKLQQGNGAAVFNFGLTPTEQGQFNTILAMSGSSGFFAGLGSQLGCPTGAPAGCLPSNDGADSFIGFRQIPAPLIGHGFLALLAIGGVLFGGKLLESLKKYRSQVA
jgi:hypothetical protein